MFVCLFVCVCVCVVSYLEAGVRAAQFCTHVREGGLGGGAVLAAVVGGAVPHRWIHHSDIDDWGRHRTAVCDRGRGHRLVCYRGGGHGLVCDRGGGRLSWRVIFEGPVHTVLCVVKSEQYGVK